MMKKVKDKRTWDERTGIRGEWMWSWWITEGWKEEALKSAKYTQVPTVDFHV